MLLLLLLLLFPLPATGLCSPNAHVGPGDLGKLDGSGETLVTLGIVVLETDLELDGLEEVPLLLIEGVVKELLDVGTHSSCGIY